MRLIISFAALFLSVVFLQLSSGGLGPLDALSGVTKGFSATQIGMLGSAHFLGFFVGCWWAPRLMGSIGHSRAFAAFAATGMIGILGHTLFESASVWALLRIGSGICVAGCYSVIEAWLQSKLTNQNRGRAMGSYRMVDMGSSLCAQLLISVLEPAHYVSYNILAIFCCAALLPLTLTRVQQPKTPDAPRLRPILAYRLSPLAAIAVVVAGLTSSSFRMVSPIYGIQVGLEIGQIALFLAAFVVGGAVAQYPVGWLADKFDRRHVLIGLSIAAVASSALTIGASSMGTQAVFLSAALFGLTTFPIFSVAAAHANDFAKDDQIVELSAALIFFFALGAIGAPLITSGLIQLYGPAALFIFTGVAHIALAVASIVRTRARPTSTDKTRYHYVPRTSLNIGRLVRRPKP